MKFEIDSGIIKTTDCDKDFMCLKAGGEKHICKISRSLNGMYCFIQESNHRTCSKRISFGYSVICKCPVRCKIYEKYGI